MKHIKIDDHLYRKLQALFDAHQAADSCYHYADVRDMVNHILYRVANGYGASMGSESAALLNILNIEASE